MLIEMHSFPLDHKASCVAFWENGGIVPWLLGLLELIEMHTQCPIDSQASSVTFLGKLWHHSLAFFAVLFCFVTLAVQVALHSIMGQCDQQFTICV